MAKKKIKRQAQLEVDTTIELRLPDELYKRVMDLKKLDKALLDETVRAVFGHDELYGMNHVVIKKSTLKEVDITRLKPSENDTSKKAGYWKLCEG